MKHIFVIAIFLAAPSAMANMKSEVSHLLNFVENTACTYERNGKKHTGVEAVKHIKKKYDYFKDDIESTEDFIKYSATKSKMSGKYYLVHCDGKPSVKSQEWLIAELKSYRKKIN